MKLSNAPYLHTISILSEFELELADAITEELQFSILNQTAKKFLLMDRILLFLTWDQLHKYYKIFHTYDQGAFPGILRVCLDPKVSMPTDLRSAMTWKSDLASQTFKASTDP